MAACLACGCQDMAPNPFQPEKCINCQHVHTRKPISRAPPASAGAPGATSAPAAQKTAGGGEHAAPGKEGKKAKKDKGKLGGRLGSFTGRRDKDKEPEPRDKNREESKRDSGGLFSRLRGKHKDSKESSSSGVSITGPTDFRRGAHIGYSESGGFETMNLPPDLSELLQSINVKLQEAGQKPMTKDEAAQLLSNIDMVKNMGQKSASSPRGAAAAATAPPPQQNSSASLRNSASLQSPVAQQARCPSCSAALSAGSKFCTGCGAPIRPANPPPQPKQPTTPAPSPAGAKCARCGAVPAKPEQKFCTACGGEVATGRPPAHRAVPSKAPPAAPSNAAQQNAALGEIENLRKRLRAQEEQNYKSLKDTAERLARENKAIADAKRALEAQVEELRTRRVSPSAAQASSSASAAQEMAQLKKKSDGEIAALREMLKTEAVARVDLKKLLEKERASGSEEKQKSLGLEKEKQALVSDLSKKDMEISELQAKLRVVQSQEADSGKQRMQFDKELQDMQHSFAKQLESAKATAAKEGELRATELLTQQIDACTKLIDDLKQQLVEADQKVADAVQKAQSSSGSSDKEITALKKKLSEDLAKAQSEVQEAQSREKAAERNALDAQKRVESKDERIHELEAEIDRLMAASASSPSVDSPSLVRQVESSPPPPPPPPMSAAPPPPPPMMKAGGPAAPAVPQSPKVEGRADLLSSIQRGTTLKKVTEEDKTQQKEGPGGNDLASILAMALISRRSDMVEAAARKNKDDSSEGEDWDDESDDDDDQ
eukprot:m51a1_g2676 hypothetical protein (774) ;mRNA; r:729427-732248